MRFLVTYGSARGGTQGLASMIAQAIRDQGFTAEVLPSSQVGRLADYDAVIVGGALYAGRWHKAARRFVRRHGAELRQMPVYLFSSGPLDDSASRTDIPPVAGVKRLMTQVGARGHITFGGRLAPDAKGFPARQMARKLSGDWRDLREVGAWTHDVIGEVAASAVRRDKAAGQDR
jgi:menaquinone-dependent protoporphyrinogen oxidase